jgi:hypothetical protein
MRRAPGSSVPASPSPRPLPSREREKINNGPGGINSKLLAFLPFKSLPHHEETAKQHLPLPSREREGVRGRPQVADGVFHSFRTLPADHGPQGSLNARARAGRARSLQKACRPSGCRKGSSGTPEPPPLPTTGRTSSWNGGRSLCRLLAAFAEGVGGCRRHAAGAHLDVFGVRAQGFGQLAVGAVQPYAFPQRPPKSWRISKAGKKKGACCCPMLDLPRSKRRDKP